MFIFLLTANGCSDIVQLENKCSKKEEMTMLKKYRIASAPRFITFITICVLLVIFTLISILGINNAEGLSDKSAVYQCRQIEVSSGDTLWDLASEYGPEDADIRETIHVICTLNDVDAGSIQAGDIIMIPSVI